MASNKKKMKSRAKPHRIVCHISGGVLQGVWSSDAATKVTLFDFDNFDGAEKDHEGRTEDEFAKQFEEMTSTMHEVF